jgi:hypothetical protein
LCRRALLYELKQKINIKEWLKQAVEKTLWGLSHPEDYYFSIWYKDEVPLLIEPDMVAKIKSLQSRGVMVLALTNLPTGSRGKITLCHQTQSSRMILNMLNKLHDAWSACSVSIS